MKKMVSTLLSTLLLLGLLTLAFNVEPVRASGTIYIRPDGTVQGTDKIQRDGDVYTFTDNIFDAYGIRVERDNIIVDGAGYSLQGTGAWYSKGIDLSGRSNVAIKNVEITEFSYGVYLNYSSNNAISGNTIASNNWYGILLDFSSSNVISGNNMTNNVWGILLFFSSDNLIVENAFVNDGLFVSSSYGNVVEGNLVNGKPLVYLEGFSDYAVGEAGQVILVNCTAITVENLNLSNTSFAVQLWGTNNTRIASNNIAHNFYGIQLSFSSSNVISGNNVTNNACGIASTRSSNNVISGNNIEANYVRGIWLHFSLNNVISNNNIADNECGIMFHDSSNNIIYHNNFRDNTKQIDDGSWTYPSYPPSINTWDDGYPSGGNYWSNHVMVDECCGANQDEPGSDGIVDEPYVIDANNRDHYPLVEPWSPVIPATIDIAPDTLHLMSRGQWITCYIELPEGYDVSDIDVSTVMLNDTIAVSLLDVPAPEPVPTEVGDYDNDTIPDLMVKFDRAMVSAFILSKRITNGVITLAITGDVNGTPFEGTDTIRVLMGGGGTGRRK